MSSFKEALKLNEVRNAIIISFVISLPLSCLIIKYGNILSINTNYSSFLSLSAAFIGFLITAFTILITFPSEGRITDLKKFENYPQLFYFFIISIFSQVMLFLVILVGLLFNITDSLYLSFVIFILILSIYFLILVIWVLKRMTDLYFTK